MKTYKEINEKITVPKDIRNAAVDKMIHKPKLNYTKAVLRFACVLLIAFGALQVMNSGPASPSKQTSKQPAVNRKEFRINDYLVSKQMESSPSKIVGIVSDLDTEEMDREMLKTVQDDFPTMEQLNIPDGFESKLFYRKFKHDENSKQGYPMIDYYAEKDKYTLTLNIQDNHIPQCVVREGGDSYLKGYKGYQIAVVEGTDQEGNKLFWTYGTYKNYNIEIYAMVEQADDFEQFMQSFLK